MKTNHSVRRMLRIQNVFLCLALVAVVVAELALGWSLATRVGQDAGFQGDEVQAPNVSLDEVFVSIR